MTRHKRRIQHIWQKETLNLKGALRSLTEKLLLKDNPLSTLMKTTRNNLWRQIFSRIRPQGKVTLTELQLEEGKDVGAKVLQSTCRYNFFLIFLPENELSRFS